MSRTLKVSIATQSTAVPITTPAAADIFRVQLLSVDGTVAHTLDQAGVDFTIQGVLEGDYTVTACRLDVTGAAIGEPIRQAYTVLAAGSVQVDLPSGLSISVE